MKKYLNVLISFVGTNDGGKLLNKKDGAILTVLKHRKFDKVYLLWTSSYKNEISYDKISDYLVQEIKKRKYCSEVVREYINIEDVTDHNEIYPKLLNFLKSKFKSKKIKVTAAIASGTPSMQACWIIMSESRDFPMELIRSNEPELNTEPITVVKLGTALPRIIRLKEENKMLKRAIKASNKITVNIGKCEINIKGIEIPFSPIQFCYYRYFLERAYNDEGPLLMKGYNMPTEFSQRILDSYKECYTDYDYNIISLKKKLSMQESISTSNFRSNVSKVNSILKEVLQTNYEQFLIQSIGQRFKKQYCLFVPKENINFIK